MLRSHWVRASMVGVLLLLPSCSSVDAPTSATGTSSVLPAERSANSVQDDRRAEHQRLLDLLRQTKDSLKAERELHRDEFREARKQWQMFRKELKRSKKLGDPVELLRCEPQEYTAAAELIGPEGGSVKVGPHELKVPKGALDHEVVISAAAPVSDLVEVELQPEGLRFATPAQLKLSYEQCVQPPSWLNLFIVHLDDAEEVLEATVSVDKKGLKAVYGDLNHFSRYAVAW